MKVYDIAIATDKEKELFDYTDIDVNKNYNNFKRNDDFVMEM